MKKMKKVLNPLILFLSVLLFLLSVFLISCFVFSKYSIGMFLIGTIGAVVFVFSCFIFRQSIQIEGGPTDRISSGDWKILYKKEENLLLEHEITEKIFFFKIPKDCIIKIEEGTKKEKRILEQGKSFYFVREGKNYILFPLS